jgi:hypothetical protein
MMASGTENPSARSGPQPGMRERDRDPRERGETAMPAMGKSMDGPEEANLVGLCFVPNCMEHGVQEVIQEIPVRWPSGRQLMGNIVHHALICEYHFESLVRGHNVP